MSRSSILALSASQAQLSRQAPWLCVPEAQCSAQGQRPPVTCSLCALLHTGLGMRAAAVHFALGARLLNTRTLLVS